MATEFVCVIKTSGGDYTHPQTWDDAIDCDVSSTANRIYSSTVKGAGAADTTAMHLWRGGTIISPHVHGTMTHATVAGNRIFMTAILDYTQVQTGDVWSTSDANDTNGYTVTATVGAGNGDVIIPVAELDGEISTADAYTIASWSGLSAGQPVRIRSKNAAKRSDLNALAYGSAAGRFLYSGTAAALTISEDFVEIEDIDIKRTDATAASHGISVVTTAAGSAIYLRRVLVDADGTSGGRALNVSDADTTLTADDCIFIERTGTRAVTCSAGTTNLRNCIAYATGAGNGGGVTVSAGATCNATNCYANHKGTGGAWASAGTLNLDHCGADDTTGTPAALDNLAAADQFTAVGVGTEDFRPLATSALIDVGVTIAGLTTDIFGNPITAGYEDVGPVEYQGTGNECSGSATFPAITTTGAATRGIPVSGSATFPAMTATGLAKRGSFASGTGTFGAITASGGIARRSHTCSGSGTVPGPFTATGKVLGPPTQLFCNDSDASAGSSNPNNILDLTPVFSCIVAAFADADITQVQLQVSAAGDSDFSEPLAYDSGLVALVTPVGNGARIENQVYGAVQ